jgi:hypothetical protein
LPTTRILELCVGDTIDASPTGGGRRAFPRNKAELLQAPQGDRMFEIARQGLVDMAACIPAYRGAASRPDKFCHGFGIFQLDLQFFKTEPDYFLSRRYADFDVALARCVGELKSALRRIGWQAKASLSDAEIAGVAIAYNTGRYDPAKGLKQGYFDGSKYYGENFYAYLQLAKGVHFPAGEAAPSRDARALSAAAKKPRKPAKKAVKSARKVAKSAKSTKPTGAAKTRKAAKRAKVPAAKTPKVVKASKAVEKTAKKPAKKAAKKARGVSVKSTAKRAKATKTASKRA